ncbi:hypothetical protein ACB092_11G153600 [Castanea dentata]
MGCKELAIDIPLVMEPVRWPECCIYRVPKKLREVYKDAYTPKLSSIGPLHHGECELHAMEMLKLRYLREFCYRTGTCHKDIAGVIETNELKIRRCYEEIFDISSEDFVKMVVLDSIFIIEHFLRSAASDGLFNRTPACGKDESHTSEEDGCCNARGDEKHCILSKPLLRKHIQEDLLLLENQLPFFILDELHTIFQLARYYFFSSFEKKTNVDKKNVKHFTDFMRYFYYPWEFNSTGQPIETLHNAKKVDEAGVIFKKADGRRLLDIQFKKSNFTEIFPCFTCSWLLRCLPFLKHFHCLVNTQTFLEVPRLECHYPFVAYICNYMVLLDFLINTREDVELLVEKGIIVNKLGSNKAAATMVNKLGLEIEQKRSCYQDLAQLLNG